MDYEDVSVDQHRKLQLTWLEDTAHPDDPHESSTSQAPEQRDPGISREALVDLSAQREAEQALMAEAREQANSAEPPESGALTVEWPRAE